MRRPGPGGGALALILALAVGFAVQARAEDGWQPGSGGDDGGWLSTFLDEAGFHEDAFNLGAALRRYRQACELAAPAGAGEAWWTDWILACEGMVDSAFAVEDWDALDRALLALLTARPDHPFPAARFPPLVRGRAAELAEGLDLGGLVVVGAPAPVTLDGRPLGIAPLELAQLPAGRHRIGCGALGREISVPPGARAEVRCPGGGAGGPLTDRIVEGEPTWLPDGSAEGIGEGVWVFLGGERPVGLLVGPDGGDEERWNRAVRSVRTR